MGLFASRQVLACSVAALSAFIGLAEEKAWDYRDHLVDAVQVSSGYFDTLCVPGVKPKVTMTFQRVANSALDVFGTKTRQAGCFILNVDGGKYWYRYGTSAHAGGQGANNAGDLTELACDTSLVVNGTTLQTVPEGDFSSCTETICIPGRTYQQAMIVKSFCLETNGVKACELVPCLKDKVAGFWDTVGERFLGVSAGGSVQAIGTHEVFEINVPTGTIQTNLTATQQAEVKSGLYGEVRKTGGGTLRVESAAGIGDFTGTVRISDGVWVLACKAGNGHGALGVALQSTAIVEKGASLVTDVYLTTYSSETAGYYCGQKLRLAGDGYPGMGGAFVCGYRYPGWTGDGYRAFYPAFWHVTLDDDATIVKGDQNAYFHMGCTLDMNGHDLKVKNGLNIYGFETITNPGNITLDGNFTYTLPSDNWQWDGDASNEIVLTNGAVAAFRADTGADRRCGWTIHSSAKTMTLSAGNSSRVVLDTPIKLESGATLKLVCGTTGADVDFWMNGAICGDINVTVDACAGHRVYLDGTNTFTGTLELLSGSVVLLGKHAFNGWADDSRIKHAAASGRAFGFAGLSEQRPDGWTPAELWTILERLRVLGKWGFAVYADPGVDCAVDCEFEPGKSYSGQCVFAYGGGRAVLRGEGRTADGSFFIPYTLNSNVKNVVFSAKDLKTSHSVWGDYTLYRADVTFENLGFITMGGYSYIPGVNNNYSQPAKLTIGSNTVVNAVSDSLTSPKMNGKPLYPGGNGAGCSSVLTVLDGAIVSNGFWVSGAAAQSRQSGAAIIRGGAVRAMASPAAFTVGVCSNGIAYLEVDGGEVTAGVDAAFGKCPPDSGFTCVWQRGGEMNLLKDFQLQSQTPILWRHSGGTFRYDGHVYFPQCANSKILVNCSNGVMNAVYDQGSRIAYPGGMTLGDRVNSTGTVCVVEGAVVATPSVERAATTSMYQHWSTLESAGFLSFNGGCLEATKDGAQLLGSGETAVTRATVFGEGAILSATNGVTATVSAPLEKPYGQGVAEIAITNDFKIKYYACPEVRITGDGCGAVAVAEYDSVNETVTAVKVVSPGWGYTTAEAELYFGGGTPVVPVKVTLGDAVTTGGVTKRGAGTVVLNAANTYGGDTVLEEGVLKLGAADALPATSTIVCKGGVIDLNGQSPTDRTFDLSALPFEKGAKYVLAEHCGEGLPTFVGLPEGWIPVNAGGTLKVREPTGVMLIVR